MGDTVFCGSTCLSVTLFLDTGGQLFERDERVELCHTELDMFSRGARTRTSLDCAMGRFLGTFIIISGHFVIAPGHCIISPWLFIMAFTGYYVGLTLGRGLSGGYMM